MNWAKHLSVSSKILILSQAPKFFSEREKIKCLQCAGKPKRLHGVCFVILRARIPCGAPGAQLLESAPVTAQCIHSGRSGNAAVCSGRGQHDPCTGDRRPEGQDTKNSCVTLPCPQLGPPRGAVAPRAVVPVRAPSRHQDAKHTRGPFRPAGEGVRDSPEDSAVRLH